MFAVKSPNSIWQKNLNILKAFWKVWYNDVWFEPKKAVKLPVWKWGLLF